MLTSEIQDDALFPIVDTALASSPPNRAVIDLSRSAWNSVGKSAECPEKTAFTHMTPLAAAHKSGRIVDSTATASGMGNGSTCTKAVVTIQAAAMCAECNATSCLGTNYMYVCAHAPAVAVMRSQQCHTLRV